MSIGIGTAASRQAALRPREQLLHLMPLNRVLARLDELGLEYKEGYCGYVAQCPNHRSDQGRLNFEVKEIDRQMTSPSGTVLPAGAVLLVCQAYHDAGGRGGCDQQAVVAALGLNFSDLYPGKGSRYEGYDRGGRLRPLGHPGPRAPLPADEVARWTALALAHEADLSATRLEQLAGQLGVPAQALRRFHVGWIGDDVRRVDGQRVEGRCWSVPERDGRERVTGVTRRYEDGGKQAMAGSRRGLYVPDGWRAMPGPVYCPEGFSDAAAVVAAGGCAVGRPNARGGVDELAELLRGDPRAIVVLGENDDKAVVVGGASVVRRDGYDGAVEACRRLRRLLGRDDVSAAMPPEPYKDVREYVVAGGNLP